MGKHLGRGVVLRILGCSLALASAAAVARADMWDAPNPKEPYAHNLYPGLREGLWPPGTNWPGYRDEEAGKPPRTAEGALVFWPKESRKLARGVIAKYGEPDKITRPALTWHHNGRWLKTVVFRDSDFIDADRIAKDDMLQQSVSYVASPECVGKLAAFDKRIVYDGDKHALISTSGSEELNVLALNLADEIVKGKKTPEEATAFYTKTLDLSMSGKSSPYMTELQF